MSLFGKKKQIESLARSVTQLKSELRHFKIASAKKRSAWEMAADNDLTADWNSQSVPINYQLRQQLKKLRARSRDIAKNDPNAVRFLTLAKNNIIGGSGFALQPMIKDSRNEKMDRAACSAVSNAWREFSRKGVFEITGRLSRSLFERSLVQTLFRDGEFLAIEITGKDAGNKFGYALQVLDPEVLDSELNKDLDNGNKIIMGVEHDPSGRPVAYHLITRNTRANSHYYGYSKHERIPAERVIHEFIPEYNDQSRGIPHFAPIGFRLKMLDGYDEAELVSARVAASKMGIWERAEGAAEWEGNDENENGEFVDEVRPGSIDIGPEGYTFKSFDPTHPSTAFAPFRKGMMRSIANALGVSYHQLANDLEGVNYSSGRLGALEDREVWIAIQNFLVDTVLTRVFDHWLENALLRGEIKLENGATLGGSASPLGRMKEFDRYRNVRHQGRRWPWVDPLKDIKASGEAIDRKITTVSEVIREQGRNPDDVFQEWAEEQQKFKDLGIDTVVASKPKPTSDPVDDEEDIEPGKDDNLEGDDNASS